MTTVTIVKKNGMAAIAADSMTKWGSGKETAEYVVNHHKIVRVGDTYMALTGAASAKVIFKDHFAKAKQKNARFDTVDHIFQAWLGLHTAMKETYFLNPSGDDEDEFETTRVDVAIANAHGIFGVAQHRDVQEYSKFYALGSGYPYALGAMFTVYDDPDKSAEEIARIGVQASGEFDDSTGLPIFSYSIPLIGKEGGKEIGKDGEEAETSPPLISTKPSRPRTSKKREGK